MIPLYLITQYGHPHCVKSPEASGTCKRPPCFLPLGPCFPFTAEGEEERPFLKCSGLYLEISSELTSLVLFIFSAGLFSALLVNLSLLQNMLIALLLCFLISSIRLGWERAHLLQLYLTLCNLRDRSPPGSSVHGILQARIPEWAAMSSSRGSSLPKDGTCVSSISCIGRRILYH